MTSFNEWLEQRDERFHENDDKPWKSMPQTRNYSQIAGFNDLMDGLHALRDELLLRRKSSKDVSPELIFSSTWQAIWSLISNLISRNSNPNSSRITSILSICSTVNFILIT